MPGVHSLPKHSRTLTSQLLLTMTMKSFVAMVLLSLLLWQANAQVLVFPFSHIRQGDIPCRNRNHPLSTEDVSCEHTASPRSARQKHNKMTLHPHLLTRSQIEPYLASLKSSYTYSHVVISSSGRQFLLFWTVRHQLLGGGGLCKVCAHQLADSPQHCPICCDR